MVEVDCDVVDNAHEIFSEHMQLNEASWKSIFEFAFYLNFGVINVARQDVRRGDKLQLNDRSARAVQMLAGPYVETVIAAYKHRRYSLSGRLRVACLWPCYAVTFAIAVFTGIIMDLKDGW